MIPAGDRRGGAILCFTCGAEGHKKEKCPVVTSSKIVERKADSAHKNLITCYGCGEVGHKRPQERIVAIDPGVHTFATGYAPTGPGLAFGWGKADMGRIQRLCHHADQLVSDIAKTSKAKRSRKRRALWRLHIVA